MYEAQTSVDNWKWLSFSPKEMACRHCGEQYYWPLFMNRLQAARDKVGKQFHIHSAHRCSLHNARIGGAPLSQHLRLAADIGLDNHQPDVLLRACKDVGFTGFGFYTTFLHIDLGPKRSWYGNQKAKLLWQDY
ncbi:MAG TPA: peptidase M15 [Hellea balneolensis]|uniref:Peptidase M15 n=1 Tax=Hellea balneolensis TaxID=287478 RepID=A0A7C3C510_9PROT|nr:peptidase M15 [Hellea balneolensis]